MHLLTERLFSLKDEKFAEFQRKIVSDTSYPIIGVRVPDVRDTVKVLSESERLSFLNEKHIYYEEYLAHALIISYIKDKSEVYRKLENFLPLIDNWAICDTLAAALKRLAKDKSELADKILFWIQSDNVYTVRFAVVLLLMYFTDSGNVDFAINTATSVKTEEYYINMAVAWFVSVVLIKDFEKGFSLLKRKKLSVFVHNKSIGKALDSFRISEENKEKLKTLKIL